MAVPRRAAALLLVLALFGAARADEALQLPPASEKRAAINAQLLANAQAAASSMSVASVAPAGNPATCADLKAAVDAFTKSAVANAPNYGVSGMLPITQTITLDCGVVINCTDPTLKPTKNNPYIQDLILQVGGWGTLTIQSTGCAAGQLPVITGGMTEGGAELFYVGEYPAPPANNAEVDVTKSKPMATLSLVNVAVDGKGQMPNGSPEPLRGCINAVNAYAVKVTGGELRNCVSSGVYGGGAISAEITPVTLTNTAIKNSFADGDGGAIMLQMYAPLVRSLNAALTMTNVKIDSNRATGKGGAIALSKTTIYPIAIKAVSGVSITNNQADNGCSLLSSDRDDLNYDLPLKTPGTYAAGKTPLITFGKTGLVVTGNTVGAGKPNLLMCGAMTAGSLRTFKATPIVGFALKPATASTVDFQVGV